MNRVSPPTSVLVLVLMHFWPSCLAAQPLPLWPVVNHGESISNGRIQYWRDHAPICPGKAGQYPSFPTRRELSGIDPFGGHCTDGDMTLFNGLLCAAGEQAGCAAVKFSQGRSGEWFRSPRRRAYFDAHCHDGINNSGLTAKRLCITTFSPDMGLGVLAYGLRTDDRNAVRRWLAYVTKNAKTTKICTKECRCTQPFTWPRLCSFDIEDNPDNPNGRCKTIGHCALRPTDIADYRLVSQYLGTPANLGSPLFDLPQLPNEVLLELSTLEGTFYAEHLDGVRILIRMMVANPRLNIASIPTAAQLSKISPRQWGDLNPLLLNASARALAAKNQWNPFFSLLANGPTQDVRNKILTACPKPSDPQPFSGSQWIFEQQSTSDHHLPANSSGWDCVFIALLYNRMRASAGLDAILEAHLEEALDPLQQSINVLSAAITTTQNALDTTQSLKDEQDRLEHFVLNAESEMNRKIGDATRSTEDLQSQHERALLAAATEACRHCRQLIRSAGRTCPLVPACPECRHTVRACNRALADANRLHNELQRARRNLASLRIEASTLPLKLKQSQVRLASLRKQHLLDRISQLKEHLAAERDKIQALHDKHRALKGLAGLWAGSPGE